MGGVGRGGTFLSHVAPQLGFDRARLEPKSPQYLGQRGAPALFSTLPQAILLFFFPPPCCRSNSRLSDTLHDHEMWIQARREEGEDNAD